MPETSRTDPPVEPEGLSAAERDSRIEQLLLTGLDHYFAGEYERAISAWTRVLFLDRGHVRAKAYIDRARGAIGERQRESDELLHRGTEAFHRGETEEARRLLTSAVERGGPHEVALSLLDRLVRLERPSIRREGPQGSPTGRRPAELSAPSRERRRRAWALPALVLGVIAVAVFYIQASHERTAPLLFLFGWGGPDASSVAGVPEEPLPVPRAAEMDLARARALLSQGHARDALRMLDRIAPTDPLRAEAAALREGVQRVLLNEGQGVSLAGPPAQAAGQPRTDRDQ